ncbi:MAG: cation-translocating P-type ATPase C-terminal domain-containing protein [Gemmatimonadota bacterium]
MGYAGALTAVTLAAFWRGLTATGHPPGHAATLSFMTLAFAEIFHLGNARSSRPVMSPKTAFANKSALGAAVAAVLIQIAALEVAPIAAILHLTPLSIEDWAAVIGLAALPAVAGQALKAVRVRAGRR